MLDNALFALLIGILESGQPGAGIPNIDGNAGVPVSQPWQPTQQGVPTGPAAFLSVVGYKRVGFPHRVDRWDTDTEIMTHRESQRYETTFQLSALSVQDPTDASQLTAGDIVNLLSHILQSDATVQTLQQNDVQILRIQGVQNPYFVDDRGRFEASPSLDFVICHKQIVQNEIPVLQSEELDIYQI